MVALAKDAALSSGLALFLTGPSALALLVGRALWAGVEPSEGLGFRDLWVPVYHAPGYHLYIMNRAKAALALAAGLAA